MAMKRIFNAMLCMSAIVAVSCTKSYEPEVIGSPKMIKVSFEEPDVKSSIDGKKVLWEDNDAILIYDGSKQNAFLYNSGGAFDGEITKGSKQFYAVYPELALKSTRSDSPILVSSSNDIVKFTTFLPSYQKVRKNSVSQGAIISACQPTLEGDKLSGTMQTLNGFLKFTIADAENSKIAKVRFTAGTKYMSGRCQVVFGTTKDQTADSLYISTDQSVAENTYVECGPETGRTFENGTYYVSVLPYNYQGMTITLTTVDGKIYEYSTGSWVKPQRNTVQDLGTIDAGIVSGTGLTTKTSILVDFTTNANITNLESTGGTATIAANGTSYEVKTNALYLKDNRVGYIQSGYMETPALENKMLKNVIVTFEGALDSNCKFKMDVAKSSDRKAGLLTGLYYGSNSVQGDNGTTYALPMLGVSKHLYWSHNFVLGKQSGGETSQSIGTPAVNTSYYIVNRVATAQIAFIELIYEPVPAE